MVEKQSNSQRGVSGPLELAKMASEFVTRVKKTAREQNITDADEFIKVASESLIKFSSEKNLTPSVVERIASLFNSAKAASSLHKTAINSRGDSVSLMDPRAIVAAYKQNGLRKKADSNGCNTEDPFRNHRKQMALTIVDKDSEGVVMGHDLGAEVFAGVKAGFLAKQASAKEPKSILDQLKNCKEDELLLAKHSYLNNIHSHLRKMCSIVAVSGGPDPVEFISDVHAARPDLIGAASAFARVLTKNASASRKKITIKPRKVKPEFLRSHGGLTDHLEKVASLQRSEQYLTGLIKLAARGGGPGGPPSDTEDDVDTDTDTKGPKVGTDRVLSLFNFDNASKDSGKAQQQQPAISSKSPISEALSGHLGTIKQIGVSRLTGNKPTPSRELVDADNAARLKSTFMSLMSDEVLAEEDPYDLEEALNTLHSVAPHLAADPSVARVVVRAMIQHDGIDPLAIKQFAESEREMLRSLEAGRGRPERAGEEGR